jgi:hypothetical protein
MDSKEERALLVHMPDKIVKFKQFSNGLYAMDPNDKTFLIRMAQRGALRLSSPWCT